MKIISKIKNKIPLVLATSCIVAQENGHRYKNSRLIGRQICTIVLENLFCCSDIELPDKLEEYSLLSELYYKKNRIILYSLK